MNFIAALMFFGGIVYAAFTLGGAIIGLPVLAFLFLVFKEASK